MNHVTVQTMRRRIVVSLAAVLATAALSTPARAQDAMSKEDAAAMKAAFLADLEVVKGKFVQLGQAFPDDKMSWRPMEGVRSVGEVLALVASEFNGFVPSGLGGKPGAPREEMQALAKSTNKAELIAGINKAFEHTKSQFQAADPSTLTGKRAVMGQQRSLNEIALMIGGDLHEHLGQLIAYARMNKVVPPWSK
ncbi:MAG: DinB family protein [Acidobacteria bacterium]|nr:DinB family protein [Acidobacteriota bacterium]